jgi:uncharacterized protein (TIGR02722 family)
MQICDRFFKIAAVSVASILLFGCASEPKVAYVDPTRVQARSTNYGISDLQMLAESMTRSLLQTRIVMNAPTPPLITVAPVKNKTDQYIDTALITSKIETQLLKSGQVQFAARADGMTNITGEIARQNSGMYNKNTSTKIGNFEGAKYLLEGEITNIPQSDKKMKEVYYNLTLRLLNTDTAVYEWQDEKEIMKQEKR